jgi:type VI protein secretion system component Hcp
MQLNVGPAFISSEIQSCQKAKEHDTDAGNNRSDILSENVTLNFAKLEVQYQEQSTSGGPAGGPKIFGWDVKGNTKL